MYSSVLFISSNRFWFSAGDLRSDLIFLPKFEPLLLDMELIMSDNFFSDVFGMESMIFVLPDSDVKSSNVSFSFV